MTLSERVPVFDGHNDVLTRLLQAGGRDAAEQFVDGSRFHLDLPKARAGGLAGGLFAVWVPSPPRGGGAPDVAAAMAGAGYDVPLPEPLERGYACDVVMQEIAILRRLEALGALRVCTDVASIRACMAQGLLAAVLHIEGAEALDPDGYLLEVLYRAGLRSLGPVWSRPTLFAQGVPFRFPATPDIGSGLSDAGRRLVADCNRLGILIDCSHLNEAGFDDVAVLSDAPLVASHSNVHALCPHARNLTDRQLDVIAERDGLVGLNLATAFLRSDGRMRDDVPMTTLLFHLDHLIERLGEGGVAFGSDFDGAVVPREIADVAGLPVLIEAMRRHGYDEPLIQRLAHGNWLDLLERTWRSATGDMDQDMDQDMDKGT